MPDNRVLSRSPASPIPWGAVYFRKSNPPREDWARDYATAARDGMNAFRHWFLWSAIETAPGVYDWEDYDRQLDLAAEHGFVGTLVRSAEGATDDWRAAAEVDGYGFTWVACRQGDEPWKHFHAVDLVRAAARGKPFWHAEAQGGPLILEGCPGYFGDGGRVGAVQPHLGLDALLGARESYVEFTPDLLGDLRVKLDGVTGWGGGHLQAYEPTTGTAAGWYEDGRVIEVEVGARDAAVIELLPGG